MHFRNEIENFVLKSVAPRIYGDFFWKEMILLPQAFCHKN